MKQLKKYQRLQNIHAKTKSSRNPHTQLNNIETSTDKDNSEVNTTVKNTLNEGQTSQLKKSSKFESFESGNEIDYMEIQPSKEQGYNIEINNIENCILYLFFKEISKTKKKLM